MDSPKLEKDTTNPEERDGLLNEYRTIKSEILNTQGHRLQIISLTVGALGLILSITAGTVLGSKSSTPEITLLLAVGGGIVMYAIIIPSLFMTISTQQSIQRLGQYIRLFIEPRVAGLNYENKWHEYKLRFNYKGGLRGMGGIYYFLSFLPLIFPIYALSLKPCNWLIVLTLIPFISISIYLTFDLHAAISRSWDWARWDEQEQ